jgi:hypothetical protein
LYRDFAGEAQFARHLGIEMAQILPAAGRGREAAVLYTPQNGQRRRRADETVEHLSRRPDDGLAYADSRLSARANANIHASDTITRASETGRDSIYGNIRAADNHCDSDNADPNPVNAGHWQCGDL